jgi:hypothetical protein
MDPKTKTTKQPTGDEPLEPQGQGLDNAPTERDDFLEPDAPDAHGHGEQPGTEREPDLVGTPAHGDN